MGNICTFSIQEGAGMTLYSLRKLKSGGHMLTLRQPFYDMISESNGWCIRLMISKIVRQLTALKGTIYLADESQESINEIIAKNGEHFFDDSLNYEISVIFIDGILNSKSSKTTVETFQMICVFFERMTSPR
ncbi:hypothetical protein D3C87_605400 [compost metagenome]